MTDAIQNGEVGSSVRAKLNENFVDVAALQAEAARSFDTVAELLADSTLTYTTTPAGSIVEAGGFRYTVAASAASDQHVTTAGGVKLYVQAGANGLDVTAFGAVGDGTTDDRPAFVAMNTAGGDTYIPKPPVRYNASSAFKLDNVAVAVDPMTTWANLTDGGLISAGYATSFTNAGVTAISRIPGRTFLGQAATSFAGDSAVADGGTSVFSGSVPDADKQTAHYVPMNSQFVVINDKSSYAIAGCAVGSQNNGGKGMIAVSGVVDNDIAEGRGWCFYADGDLHPGAWVVNGIEIALKNKSGVNYQYSPYVASFGNFALRLQGGGAADFGGSPTNPTTAAMIVIKGASTYNKGIIFTAEALTGTDGTVGSTGTGVALNMARRHAIQWDAPDNGIGAQIVSNVTVNTARVTQQFGDNLANFVGVNGKQFFRASHTTGGVNYLQVSSAATGFGPTIAALGDDTDIDLFLVPKGAGNVRFGTRTASSDVPVTGYIEIKDAGGTVRRLAVVG